MIGRRSIRNILTTCTLHDIPQVTSMPNKSLLAAKKLGLSRVKVSDRIGDLSQDIQDRLYVAAVASEPLHGVTAISNVSDSRFRKVAKAVLSSHGMDCVSED